jgi:hypothetical protein
MMASRAHTNIEVLLFVLFMLLCCWAFGSEFTRRTLRPSGSCCHIYSPRMPNSRIIVVGGSCQNAGGIVPKGRRSGWLTELDTRLRGALPAAAGAFPGGQKLPVSCLSAGRIAGMAAPEQGRWNRITLWLEAPLCQVHFQRVPPARPSWHIRPAARQSAPGTGCGSASDRRSRPHR